MAQQPPPLDLMDLHLVSASTNLKRITTAHRSNIPLHLSHIPAQCRRNSIPLPPQVTTIRSNKILSKRGRMWHPQITAHLQPQPRSISRSDLRMCQQVLRRLEGRQCNPLTRRNRTSSRIHPRMFTKLPRCSKAHYASLPNSALYMPRQPAFLVRLLISTHSYLLQAAFS
jgi:hypothetical protein